MNKIIFICTICLLLNSIVFPDDSLAIGIAKIVVEVVDEVGAPIGDTDLNIRFSSDSNPVAGKTNGNGVFTVKSSSNDGLILIDARKEGYYLSGTDYSFYVKKLGFYQPWGKKLKVVMRPIVNPVPMYVRSNFFEIPIHGEEIGFDLEKGDWVIPYGQGGTADFIVQIEKQYVDIFDLDISMSLTFSHPHDGMLMIKDDGGGDFDAGSQFRLPRMAPDEGYDIKRIDRHLSRGSFGNDISGRESEDANYLFRVRSEVDEEGNLVEAMYGKIRGGLHLVPTGPRDGGRGGIKLHYYLNPDQTRNLEYDPKHNLFKTLPRGEENVRYP